MIRVAVAGAGAIGRKHLATLSKIGGVEIASVISDPSAEAEAIARQYHAPFEVDLRRALDQYDINAIILCTPTNLHAWQAISCMKAGKHVQIEIPMADSWSDAQAVLAVQKETGLICMVGHTRRFNPGHRWLHQQIASGQFALQHLNVQTYFHRRQNLNAEGQRRSWTDHLLWHHAAHTVDLFAHQAGPIVSAHGIQGPRHPELRIAMDLSLHLKSESDAICALSLSFNNDGPFGSWFRYIGDTGTYLAHNDALHDGFGNVVSFSEGTTIAEGIELQDREFVEAIVNHRQPKGSVLDVIDCYRVLGALSEQLRETDGWS